MEPKLGTSSRKIVKRSKTSEAIALVLGTFFRSKWYDFVTTKKSLERVGEEKIEMK